jgi:hypothetical protein
MSAEPDTRSLAGDRVSAETVKRARIRLFRVCFGDRGGLFVFLASLTVMMLLWRFQFFITDNYTLANGLAAFGDGQLHVTDPAYRGSLTTPGMVEFDGRAYPRNMGHLVVALPTLLVLRAVTAVMDLHVAVAAAWSLVLMGTVVTAGRLLERPTVGDVLGSGLALLAFSISLAMAEPARLEHYALPALQLTTLLLAGLLAVLLYRLIRRAYGRRVGLTAGLATGLATPTLLWATVPKRHVPIGALALCSAYLFYRSRMAESTKEYRRFRLLAYAPVGLAAWVFVAAGAMLFISLVFVDIATARENHITSLAGIAGVVVVSSIPFFVTNVLITGDPFTSPFMLPSYQPPDPGGAAAGGGGGGSGSGSTPSVRGASTDSPLPAVLQQVLYLVGQYTQGLEVALSDPDRLTTVFVRSGWFEELSKGTGGAISLSVAESMPLVGALLGAPLAVATWLRRREFEAIHAVDCFLVVYGLLTLLLYLPRLPLHAQVTVRYLYVLYPMSIYGLVRLPWTRNVIRTRTKLLAWTYAAGVLIGGQLLFAWLVRIDAALDEAMQAIAIVGLGTAALLAAWSLASAAGRDSPRVGAVLLGLAGSIATNLYLIVILYYYGGQFALPFVPA